jgi:hypothetical protein
LIGPRPNTATQVAVDAFAAFDEDTQKWLREHAVAIIAWGEAGKWDNALGYLEDQRLDTEEQLALWSLLPSNVRSAIKKQKSLATVARTAAPRTDSGTAV